jgi:2-polyprenyl-3-methyl-5-hydroxy-6-metoxy-1,4-benzoquinol methylase
MGSELMRICIYLMLFFPVVSGLEDKQQWLYQPESKWDQEWKSGDWDYMDTVPIERSRIAVIGGVFSRIYTPVNSSVLDVGCGEGAISDYLLPEQRPHYVGLDLSKEAIHLAKKKRGAPMKFVHIAAHHFQPLHKFDVIIFSEVLYYVEYEKVLNQYDAFLKDNGVIIISIFQPTDGKQLYENIFKYAQTKFNKIDYTDIHGFTKKKENAAKIKTSVHIEVYRKR